MKSSDPLKPKILPVYLDVKTQEYLAYLQEELNNDNSASVIRTAIKRYADLMKRRSDPDH